MQYRIAKTWFLEYEIQRLNSKGWECFNTSFDNLDQALDFINLIKTKSLNVNTWRKLHPVSEKYQLIMKPFSKMSSAEIQSMSDEDFKSVPPFEKRSCADCAHLKQALNFWCSNEKAAKVRGTRIPGCIKCPFWDPDWEHIDEKYKTPENGYHIPVPPEPPEPRLIKEDAFGFTKKLFNRILKKIKS